MKTHQTKRIYRVRCKSGIMGWRTRLQNVYENPKEFVAFSIMRGLSKKLGYAGEREAWRANPVIEGSVNPGDFRKVKS